MADTHTTDEATQLETALGLREQKLEIRGQVITVREFSLTQIPALLRLIGQIKKAGREVVTWTDPASGTAIPLEKEDWIQAILDNGEQGLVLIRLACRDLPDDAPLAALLPVIGAIFEVNTDFFDQLKGFGGGKLSNLIKGIGVIPGQTS